jgi:hypothetical protein
MRENVFRTRDSPHGRVCLSHDTGRPRDTSARTHTTEVFGEHFIERIFEIYLANRADVATRITKDFKNTGIEAVPQLNPTKSWLLSTPYVAVCIYRLHYMRRAAKQRSGCGTATITRLNPWISS